MVGSPSFGADRLSAVHDFAQTIIVIDDEATFNPQAASETVGKAKKPSRGAAKKSASKSPASTTDKDTHLLDAKTLTNSAMELGLVCSVLQPSKGEELRDRVVNASRRVDIVCLDWEIHDDEGDTAKKLIQAIVESDNERNGRLRLIAIYTGERGRQKVFDGIYDSFDEEDRKRMGIRKNGTAEIVSKTGLRIIHLFKKHGTQITDSQKQFQVSEEELPARLLEEFSTLSEGVLSNVALATIATIRNVAHHVVGKFSGEMDAPYFHHRTILQHPDDAEDYAVKIVLSELKSAADSQDVGQKFAGPQAIENRIRSIAGAAENLTLSYEKKDGEKLKELKTSYSVNDVTDLTIKGYEEALGGIKIVEGENPGKNGFKKYFTSIFDGNLTEAKSKMMEFAVLTGVRRHPGSFSIKGDANLPRLGLGSVLQDEKTKEFFLCLQASCDSVRVKEDWAFLFVPLQSTDDTPDHVVPTVNDDGDVEHVGFGLEKRAYSKTISLTFAPNVDEEMVIATARKGKDSYIYKSVDKRTFLWVADLKQRRALRTAQSLGGAMGRLGFDEFEPFRTA